MPLTEIQSFKFCPHCGSELKSTNIKEKKTCANGHDIYIEPRPSAGGIIENEKGEILIIIRKFEPYRGSLDIPAGFCKIDETLEQALIRELKEEVNLDVKNFEYFGSYNGDYPYENINERSLLAVFHIRVDSSEVNLKAGDDAESFTFLKPEEIDLTKVTTPKGNRILHDFLQQKHQVANK